MLRADRLLMYDDEEVERMISRGADPTIIVIACNTIYVLYHYGFGGVPKNSPRFVDRLRDGIFLY
jgi:hypothetical protein